MLVAFATVQEKFMHAVAQTFQREIATAMETNLTCLVNAEAIVKPMKMPMAFVTMWTTVSVLTMPAAFATDPVTSMNADVLTFQREIVTVTAMWRMRLVSAVVLARLTLTWTASVTMRTTA
tara:strand:- start:8855 stop:9217 length:363 start_codon:yes stop_codon:yes gene_type:complete